MEEKKIEGLLLQVVPYLGSSKILKLLTPDGLLTLMSKKKESPTPFLKAHVVYTSKGKEVHPLKDFSPEDPFDALKTSFQLVDIAGKIARAALKTQKAGTNSQGIYALTLAYFKKLSSINNPENLLYSFYLKTLLHDGLLTLDPECTECDLQGSYLGPDGTTCASHQKIGSLYFSPGEWEKMNTLTFGRKFQEIERFGLDEEFKKKIEQLFEVSTI